MHYFPWIFAGPLLHALKKVEIWILLETPRRFFLKIRVLEVLICHKYKRNEIYLQKLCELVGLQRV